jgi:Flagellar hook-length control protein FliK
MTAPAAAPASGPVSGPVAAAAPRAPSQAPADRAAFAAVLDSFPGAATKSSASTAQEKSRSSNEAQQKDSSPGSADHSLMSDGALFQSLPFAMRVASMMEEGSDGADHASSLAAAPTKGLGPKESGATNAPSVKAATALRLIGERAFHFAASTPASGLAGGAPATDAPFAQALANLALQADPKSASASAAGFPTAAAAPAADAVPSGASAPAPTPAVPRAGGAAPNRVSPTRAAAHDAARSGPKPQVSAPSSAEPVARSAPTAAPAQSSAGDKAVHEHSPDPTPSATPSAPQADPFGAQLSAPFAAGASFQPDGSTASAGDAGAAPRASPLAAGPAPSAPPVREIDVDLSPGGLENVSMTMRLAGEKLSVVIRAGSSQTLSSIEGARDAIADRLAAIGQPLDSLTIKQMGVNTDGSTNANAPSADGGSAGEKWAPGERSGSNDANLSRRGAGRDRSF